MDLSISCSDWSFASKTATELYEQPVYHRMTPSIQASLKSSIDEIYNDGKQFVRCLVTMQ